MRLKDLDAEEFRVNVESGYSDGRLADLYGVSDRTVLRWRTALGIPSCWAPERLGHGTTAEYARGCRCQSCKRANRDSHRVAVAKMRTAGLPDGDDRHGTFAAYSQWGCRCDKCSAAGARRNREQYIEKFGEPDPNFFWRPEEDATLAALRPFEAAAALDRSISAAYQRRFRLGLPSKRG